MILNGCLVRNPYSPIWWLRDATCDAPKDLRWADTDTRDMLADGLTKGTISRDLLDLAMKGFF